MAVCFCTDEKYWAVTLVAVQSLKKVTANAKVYIMADKNTLLRLASFTQSLNFIPIEVSVEDIALCPANSNGFAGYIRYFIPEKVPEEKVLYLDSDMWICKDVSDLLQYDLQGFPMAACRDIGIPDFSWRSAHSLKGAYFNTGAMLMDTSQLLAMKFREKVFDKVLENRKVKENLYFPFGDQNAANSVLYNQWLELHPKYNTFASEWTNEGEMLSPSRRLLLPAVYMNCLEEALASPVVVHFAGAIENLLMISPQLQYSDEWLACAHEIFSKDNFLNIRVELLAHHFVKKWKNPSYILPILQKSLQILTEGHV